MKYTTKKHFNRKLDILICNAGISGHTHEITEDGFEIVFQVNYLAHVYLIHLLRNTLIASAPSRIVLVSSQGHRGSSITRDNISSEYLSSSLSEFFPYTTAYNNSKLCMNLVTRRLADMYRDSNVSVYCLCPGLVRSNIGRYRKIGRALRYLGNYFIKTAVRFTIQHHLTIFLRPSSPSKEKGAATVVYCATAEGLENESGAYFENCRKCKPSSKSEDEQLVDALWKITQDMLSNRIQAHE